MYGPHGSSSAVERSSLSVGQFVLLCSAALFFCTAFFLQQVTLPQFGQKTHLDLTPLKWLTQVEVGFAQGEPILDAPVKQERPLPTKFRSKRVERAKHSKDFSVLVFAKKKVLGKVASVDRLVLKAAAPTIPQHENLVAEVGSTERRKLVVMHRFLTARLMIALNAPLIQVADVQMDTHFPKQLARKPVPFRTSERLNTHLALHSRMQPLPLLRKDRAGRKVSSPTPILPVAAVAAIAVSKVEEPTVPVRTTPLTQTARMKQSEVGVLPTSPTPLKVAKQADRKPANFGRITYEPAVAQPEEVSKIDSAVKSAQEWNGLIPEGFRQIVRDTQKMDEPKEDVKLSDLEGQLNHRYWAQMDADIKGVGGEGVSEVALAAAPAPEVEVSSQTLAQVAPPVTQTVVLTPGPRVDSQVVVPPMVLASNSQLIPGPVPAPRPIDYPGAKHGLDEDRILISQSQSALMSSHETASGPAVIPTPQEEAKQEADLPPVHPVTPYVEAFDKNQTPVYARKEMLSSELVDKAGLEKRGWELSVSDAADHWSTLHWVDTRVNSEERIPLLHYNTIKSFESSRLGGIVQQAGAGIVFGKIASGWQVEFEGNDLLGKKSATFLDSQAQLLGNEDVEVERYFVYFNVNPGARLVYLNSRHGKGSGGVAVPVMAGTATYVDLTHISSDKALSGTLYDESHNSNEQLWPLSGSTVRVIGQTSAVAVTDVNGNFRFGNVVTASSYPIYIESDKVVEVDEGITKRLGFTHRYRVLQQEMQNLNLYRISRSQIRGWLKQLPGPINKETGREEPVSRDSGLVIASLSKLVASHRDLNLFPSVRSIPSSTHLVPETYTLSQAGRLQVQTALQSSETRFIGVQVPEGPIVTQVADQGRNVIWSELTFASPGVVNMVGPY